MPKRRIAPPTGILADGLHTTSYAGGHEYDCQEEFGWISVEADIKNGSVYGRKPKSMIAMSVLSNTNFSRSLRLSKVLK